MSGTLGEAARAAAQALRRAGIDTPDLDARLLAGAAAGLAPAALIAAFRDPPSGDIRSRLDALVARRLAGEPVARILGRREFWGRDFTLAPGTLVPRPDSETLIEAALGLAGREADLLVADLGTGSGCLLVTLLCELPGALGLGVDLDESALLAARANAARHGVAEHAGFLRGSWGGALASGIFDLVLCNPPYIVSGEIDGLPREVALFEPRLALDGGSDGLDAYRALFPSLRRILKPGGTGIVELGHGQAESAAAIAGEAGLSVAAAAPDLAGTPRALIVHAPHLKSG